MATQTKTNKYILNKSFTNLILFSSHQRNLFLDHYGATIPKTKEFNIKEEGVMKRHIVMFVTGQSGGSNAVFDLIDRLPYPFQINDSESETK